LRSAVGGKGCGENLGSTSNKAVHIATPTSSPPESHGSAGRKGRRNRIIKQINISPSYILLPPRLMQIRSLLESVRRRMVTIFPKQKIVVGSRQVFRGWRFIFWEAKLHIGNEAFLKF